MSLKADDLVLNAGDWDRDGHGDIIVRDDRTGALKLRRGDGEGHFGDPADRHGLRQRRPARRGRRHDRRRVAGPDGPAARRRDADLPGQRALRARGQLRRARRDLRRPPGRRSAAGTPTVRPTACSASGNTLRSTPATGRVGSPTPRRSGSTFAATTGWSGVSDVNADRARRPVVRARRQPAALAASRAPRQRVRQAAVPRRGDGGLRPGRVTGHGPGPLKGSEPWRARRRRSPRGAPGRRGPPGPPSRRVRAAR